MFLNEKVRNHGTEMQNYLLVHTSQEPLYELIMQSVTQVLTFMFRSHTDQ